MSVAEVRAALETAFAEYDDWNGDPMSLRDLEIEREMKGDVIRAARDLLASLPADAVSVDAERLREALEASATLLHDSQHSRVAPFAQCDYNACEKARAALDAYREATK